MKNQIEVTMPSTYGCETRRKFELPAYFHQRLESDLMISDAYYKVSSDLIVERINFRTWYNYKKGEFENSITKYLYNIAPTLGMLWLFGGKDFKRIDADKYRSMMNKIRS